MTRSCYIGFRGIRNRVIRGLYCIRNNWKLKKFWKINPSLSLWSALTTDVVTLSGSRPSAETVTAKLGSSSTHCGRLTHICVNELGHHWYIIVTCSAPSHYLNQWWHFVNSTVRNKPYLCISIQENSFENVVCEMAAILSRPQYVNSLWNSDTIWRHWPWSTLPYLLLD